jgi:SAM-dependent methyltransferase
MSNQVFDAGRRWDEKFSEGDWPVKPDLALVAFVSDLPSGKALDIGCGPGRNAVWLAEQGWDVTGLDASAVGLQQALERAKQKNLSLATIHGDIFGIELEENTYDLVVMANIHVTPTLRKELFSKAISSLKEGGKLFVIGHHLDDLGRVGPPDPELLFSEDILDKVSEGLEVIKLQRWERPPEDGDAYDKENPLRPISDIVLWAKKR